MPDDKALVEGIREAEGVTNGIELSHWEEEFIESIEERLDERRKLSQAQHDKLLEIWERI